MNRPRCKSISGIDVLKDTIELIKLHEDGCKIFRQLRNWDHKASKVRETNDEWQVLEELREKLVNPLRDLMKDNPLINAAEVIANRKNDQAWIAWKEEEEKRNQ